MRKIKQIQNNGSSSGNNKKNDIARFVLEKLWDTWKYLKNRWTLLYFSDKQRKLFHVNMKSEGFRYFLARETDLNMIDWDYRYILSAIKVHIYHEWEEVDIHKFAYLDVKKNILYVDQNWWKVLKITESSFETINNGDDWVVFSWWDNQQEWSFVKDALKEQCYLTKLVESMNFDESYITKEEAQFVVKQHLFSLYFGEIMETRPILVYLGKTSSGKSFYSKVLTKVFFGKGRSVTSMPSTEVNLVTTLVNEYLAFFDNVDNKLSDQIIDLLCMASTGGSIKQRKLYSDGDQLDFVLNCFIAINSRTGLFTRRDDLNSRMIFLELLERSENSSSAISVNEYVDNRDVFISQICYQLQNILKSIREYENHTIPFRNSCWWNFVINANKGEMDKESILTILEKLKWKQLEYTSVSDPLAHLLESILSSKHCELEQWVYYPTAELHDLLASYAKKNSHIVSYGYKSPWSIGKALNNNKGTYLKVNKIKIDIHKEGGNKLSYCFSLLDNN